MEKGAEQSTPSSHILIAPVHVTERSQDILEYTTKRGANTGKTIPSEIQDVHFFFAKTSSNEQKKETRILRIPWDLAFSI